MKPRMLALLAVFGMAALVSAGCANKEVVKSEEPVATTQKAEAPKAEPVKVEVAKPVEQPKPAEEAKPVAPPQESSQGSKASEAAMALEAIYFDFDKSDL